MGSIPTETARGFVFPRLERLRALLESGRCYIGALNQTEDFVDIPGEAKVGKFSGKIRVAAAHKIVPELTLFSFPSLRSPYATNKGSIGVKHD